MNRGAIFLVVVCIYVAAISVVSSLFFRSETDLFAIYRTHFGVGWVMLACSLLLDGLDDLELMRLTGEKRREKLCRFLVRACRIVC